jgi:uncharacterized protein (DUF2252 family)
MGPAAAGHQHLGGWASEWLPRITMRDISGQLRRRLSAGGALSCRRAVAVALLSAVDVDRLRKTVRAKSLRQAIARAAKRSRHRTCDRALPRFTTKRGRRIVSEPPLITRVPKAAAAHIAAGLDAYLTTLAPHWRRALGNYTLVDIAHKVVGVGSVGLRAYIALLQGSTADDVMFLQLKQARRSVLAPYVHGPSAWHAHQGQRVAEYQQALQTVSDPLLGWTTIEGLQYYVRQFRNMKGSVPLNAMDVAALSDYTAIVGHLLAKGHARTGRASAIAGDVGGSDKLDQALSLRARLRGPDRSRSQAAIEGRGAWRAAGRVRGLSNFAGG